MDTKEKCEKLFPKFFTNCKTKVYIYNSHASISSDVKLENWQWLSSNFPPAQKF